MDVTRQDFVQKFAAFQQLIESPDLAFMAFDEEMSGINLSPQDFRTINNPSLLPEERYNLMVPVATKFTVMQLGVTLFLKNGDGYKAAPFNFMVFPHKDKGEDFSVSPSAFQFLADNHMDFNAWVSTGIPFTNERMDAEMEKRASRPPQQQDSVTLVNQPDIDFAKTQLEALDQWIASQGKAGVSNEHLLGQCNPFLRRYFYQELETKYPSLIAEKHMVEDPVKGRKFPTIRVTCMTPEEREAYEEAKRIKKENEDTLFRGMRLVFLAMSKAAAERNVPLIGHNCLFDVLFLFAKFHGALPEKDYAAFKRLVHEKFPVIVDTKRVVNLPQLNITDIQETSLEPLYHHLLSLGCGPRVDMLEEYDSYLSSERYHEAGWDSYCTGVVFAHLQHHLATNGQPSQPHEIGNSLHLMRSLYSLSLDSEADPLLDSQPNEVPLHVTWEALSAEERTPSLNRDSFTELIQSTFGNSLSMVYVSFLGRQGVFLAVKPIGMASAAGRPPITATTLQERWSSQTCIPGCKFTVHPWSQYEEERRAEHRGDATPAALAGDPPAEKRSSGMFSWFASALNFSSSSDGVPRAKRPRTN